MSDCRPLRLAENEQSSPSQSLSSQYSHRQPTNSFREATRMAQQQETRQRGNLDSGDIHRRNVNQSNSNNRHRRRPFGRSPSNSSSISSQLRYSAWSVIQLFVPTSICMAIVVGTMKATNSFHFSSQRAWYSPMIPMYVDQSVDDYTRAWQSILNALMMVLVLVIFTTILILLYKYKFYKVIHGWLMISSASLLFTFFVLYLAELFQVYNLPMDNYTFFLFIWNFGVIGFICIHWKGPLLLQQGYLIMAGVIMALVFIRSLPDWTIWTVLAAVSVWDVVAVLCPNGPLRILVETAQERNEPLFPALIYSSAMVWEVGSGILGFFPYVTMADSKSSSQDPERKASNRTRRNDNRRESKPSSSRQTDNFNQEAAQIRRNQHPVEINYDDSAQLPDVVLYDPNISGASEMNEQWQTPVMEAGGSRIQSNNDRNAPVMSRANESNRNPPSTELEVNFQPQDVQNHQQQIEDDEGVKLGLGDFIFYSILLGKASTYNDWNITLTCYVAILVGLCMTISLLMVFKKALPALPISITVALISFTLSYWFIKPFSEGLASNQIFV